MSGHSKWSKVKHQKATTDALKGQAFTKASRGITVAVREGGGITDPEKNYRLRLALEKARSVNMPKDTIDRAMERGSTGGEQAIESLMYEGFGPGGVALVIETTTDNRARTVSEVKHIIEHHGGSLAGRGSVSFLFDQKGRIRAAKTLSSDRMTEVAIEAGADDVVEEKDYFDLFTSLPMLMNVKNKLQEKGVEVLASEAVWEPKTKISPQSTLADKVSHTVDELEALDDVQKVYTNI